MINRVEWDSNFFGYPVGIFKIETFEEFDLKKFKAESEKFKLVYFISEIEYKNIPNLKLVDKKIIYTKKISQTTFPNSILEFDANRHSYNELLELAYLSGSYSRFKCDSNFTNNEFRKLYKEWLDKSITNELAFKILIKEINEQIAGFITFKKKEPGITQIGLIAVGQKFQGKGIGTNLIKECEFLSLADNCSSIEVATQFDNKLGMKLYESYNFFEKSNTYIYHFWNI